MEYAFILLLAYASYLSVEKYVHTGSLLAWRGRPPPPGIPGRRHHRQEPVQGPAATARQPRAHGRAASRIRRRGRPGRDGPFRETGNGRHPRTLRDYEIRGTPRPSPAARRDIRRDGPAGKGHGNRRHDGKRTGAGAASFRQAGGDGHGTCPAGLHPGQRRKAEPLHEAVRGHGRGAAPAVESEPGGYPPRF